MRDKLQEEKSIFSDVVFGMNVQFIIQQKDGIFFRMRVLSGVKISACYLFHSKQAK